jgi:hypothetical protein
MPILTGLITTTTEGVLTPPNHGTFTKSLSGWSGKLFVTSGMVYRKTYTSFHASLYITGTTGGSANGAKLALAGAYPFTATCGGAASLTATLPTLNASGTPESMGRVIVSIRPSLLASGTTSLVGRAYLTLAKNYPQYPHTFGCGGVFAKKLSGYSFTGHGVTDKLGEVRVKLHHATLSAHGIVDNIGVAILTAPAMRGAPSALIITKMPRTVLYAIGTTGAATAYEAYSLTFIEGGPQLDVAGTHYTNYPFDRFVRFNNIYYGVAADGLYELNGNTFNGTPIVAVVETANTDFKTPQLKRAISLYIAGEVGADFKVTVNSAEVIDDRYNYRTVDKTGARNYRVIFGKAIRARYLSYAFTNTNGGDFVLDDITPEYAVLRRTA